MKTKSFADMRCSIARSLDQVGSWWSLLIIREAMMGARRFKHFEASLGIAKNTLTNRLTQLVDSGILKKRLPDDGSSYEEYVLTKKGRELAPVMIALSQWGDKWVPHQDGPHFAFIDSVSGRELKQVWPRRDNGEKIQLRDIRLKTLDHRHAETGPDDDR